MQKVLLTSQLEILTTSQHLQHVPGSLALHEVRVETEAAPCAYDARDDTSMTALLRAAHGQDWEEVRSLMLSGADPSGADCQGLTALHYASFHGNMKLAQTLIEHGPAGLVFREAPGGETSLYVACQEGHVEIAKALIEAGGEALLLKTTECGASCLHIACQNGQLEIAKALIEAGGEELLLMTTKGGCSCLHSACLHGHVEIAETLIKAGGEALLLKAAEDGRSCLHIACYHGHLEIAKALVNGSGDARAALLLMTDSVHGLSCLHLASGFGHVAIVDFLLSRSCPGFVGLQNRRGRTALDIAVNTGHIAAAEAIRAFSGRPAPPQRPG